MSAAAITLVVANEDAVARVVSRVSGDALPMRIGLAYPLARRFRDLAGRCNQVVAAGADEVFFVCCGLPLRMK